ARQGGIDLAAQGATGDRGEDLRDGALGLDRAGLHARACLRARERPDGAEEQCREKNGREEQAEGLEHRRAQTAVSAYSRNARSAWPRWLTASLTARGSSPNVRAFGG